MYRVKEYNNIYELGWIYVSNIYTSYTVAIIHCIYHYLLTGNKTTVDEL